MDGCDHLAITTYFKEPIFRVLREYGQMEGFRWLMEKMGTKGARDGDHRVFCTYYNEQGHYTTTCKPFKLYFEELVRLGRMENWID